MYSLRSGAFLLELTPEVRQDDLSYPVNTTLEIRVCSFGFSAAAKMDVAASELAAFAAQLNRLYETLKGTARLEEPYGPRSRIEFTAVAGGHIEISGSLGNTVDGYSQSISFQNSIDQTCLRDFSKKLLSDHKKYMSL